MIELHDWREMPNVKLIRQGDTFTHIWHNRSLLRKPITNVMTQSNYVIQGSMVSKPDLIKSSITGSRLTAWGSSLDISTAPKYGTILNDAEANLESKKARKRMRTETQEDLVMAEVVDIAFDHQRSRKTNSTDRGSPPSYTINVDGIGGRSSSMSVFVIVAAWWVNNYVHSTKL